MLIFIFFQVCLLSLEIFSAKHIFLVTGLNDESLEEIGDDCPLLMLFTKETGVGVFAGSDLQPEVEFELAIGIPVLSDSTETTELAHYVEGLNSTHNLVTLGFSMLYNHASHDDAGGYMINKYTSDTKLMTFNEPYGTSWDISFFSAREIKKGEQLFSHYGEQWFPARNLTEIAPYAEIGGEYCLAEEPHKHFTRIPGCPHGWTSVVQGRVYAKRAFSSGEYVEVSRVLRLTEAGMKGSGPIEHFLWYLPGSQGNLQDNEDGQYVAETYTLLLLGHGALYQPPREPLAPSLMYSWWTAECILGNKYNCQHQEEGQNEDCTISNATSDCLWVPSENDCSSRMFISFRASRDIAEGEELTIDLFVDSWTKRRYPSHTFPKVCFVS